MTSEIPPTAGLPLALSELFGAGGGFVRAAQNYVDAPYAGLACSGTACLVLLLTAMHRLSARRTVIVPAWTCPLVALAVAHCGLNLQLCDLDGLNLDVASLDALCNDDTLAIVPTHFAGRVAQIAPVLRVARRCGAFVLEDAAQSFGARRHGKSVGLEGDAGFFSFAAGKGLSLYEAGLWVTAHSTLAAEIERISEELITNRPAWEFHRCLELVGYALFYRPGLLPWVYGRPLRRALKQGDLPVAVGDVFPAYIPLHRVGPWREGVGRRALSRLTAFHQQTRIQAQRRLDVLARLPGIQLFRDEEGEEGVWPCLMLCLPDSHLRDNVMNVLWGAGLGVTRMFIHALPDYDYLHLPQTDCPRARDFAARMLTITNSLWLDEVRFAQIVDVLERHT